MAKGWFRKVTPEFLERCAAKPQAMPFGANWVQSPRSASDLAASHPLPPAGRSEPMFTAVAQYPDADAISVQTLRTLRYGR